MVGAVRIVTRRTSTLFLDIFDRLVPVGILFQMFGHVHQQVSVLIRFHLFVMAGKAHLDLLFSQYTLMVRRMGIVTLKTLSFRVCYSSVLVLDVVDPLFHIDMLLQSGVAVETETLLPVIFKKLLVAGRMWLVTLYTALLGRLVFERTAHVDSLFDPLLIARFMALETKIVHRFALYEIVYIGLVRIVTIYTSALLDRFVVELLAVSYLVASVAQIFDFLGYQLAGLGACRDVAEFTCTHFERLMQNLFERFELLRQIFELYNFRHSGALSPLRASAW